MFELIDKSETNGQQFAMLPPDAMLEVWKMYEVFGEEERFAMFKILTGAAIYSLYDSVVTARFMFGLIQGGVDGFNTAVATFVDEVDPDANHHMLSDEDIDRLIQ